MPEPAASSSRRETRVLLATIAISVGVLLLLARFRFPEQPAPLRGEVAPAPLERLAARATYNELASIMVDLDRAVSPSIGVVRVESTSGNGRFAPAPRIGPDRAVVVVASTETIEGVDGATLKVVWRDNLRGVAVIAPDGSKGQVVAESGGRDRAGPRYVGVVEASGQGPVVRPLYVGRTDFLADPRWPGAILSMAGITTQGLPPGAALFSLDGYFIGMTTMSPAGAVVPAASLIDLVEASSTTVPHADLGVEVQALSPELARVSGAARGVIVSYVDPDGPAKDALAPGDAIESIDGTFVTTTDGFRTVARSRTPGTPATLRVQRHGGTLDVSIVARDGSADRTTPTTDSGVSLRAIPEVGSEVVLVRPGSAAAVAGLRRGDVVVRIDASLAPSPATVLRVYRALAGGDAALLSIQRGLAHQLIVLHKP